MVVMVVVVVWVVAVAAVVLVVMDIIVMRVCSDTLIGLGFLFFGLETIVIAYDFAHASRL